MSVLTKKERKEIEKFEAYFGAVEGRRELKSNMALLSDPDEILGLSHFSRSQAHAMALGRSAYEQWPRIFRPLNTYLMNLALAYISLERKGRKESIEFTAATVARDILRRAGFLKGEKEA